MKQEDVPPAAIDTCRSCKATVIWTRTDGMKDMPVDLAPGGYQTTDKAGKPKYVTANLALTIVAGVVKARVVAPKLAFGNTNLHLSHFVRCPHSKLWRRNPAQRSNGRGGTKL